MSECVCAAMQRYTVQYAQLHRTQARACIRHRRVTAGLLVIIIIRHIYRPSFPRVQSRRLRELTRLCQKARSPAAGYRRVILALNTVVLCPTSNRPPDPRGLGCGIGCRLGPRDPRGRGGTERTWRRRARQGHGRRRWVRTRGCAQKQVVWKGMQDSGLVRHTHS